MKEYIFITDNDYGEDVNYVKIRATDDYEALATAFKYFDGRIIDENDFRSLIDNKTESQRFDLFYKFTYNKIKYFAEVKDVFVDEAELAE